MHPHAIWFQNQGNLYACASRMGKADGTEPDRCLYEVFNQYGKSLKKDFADNLPLAMKAVFEFFKENK